VTVLKDLENYYQKLPILLLKSSIRSLTMFWSWLPILKPLSPLCRGTSNNRRPCSFNSLKKRRI